MNTANSILHNHLRNIILPIYAGPREERNRIKSEELSSLDEFDVVVTTFEMCVAESGFLKKRFMWTCMIVDEVSRVVG